MASSARDYPVGTRVPGTVYQVLRRIGSGGMGTVYDVEDTTIGKRYVLKALHPQLGAREDLARRMQKEARTLARLHHPNIVEVITAGVTADELHLPYYVMERLDGQSLRLVLEKKGQLELPHAYHIAIDLLDALDHAHDTGVIHRDVKPDNIFLHRTVAGVTVTKLLDFGIVSLLDATHSETAGRFLGTLRYASPEQLRGEAPTPRLDVYCAALVLYEMIAGRGPFDEAGHGAEVAACHLGKPAPRISSFAIVPGELDALLASALEKEPERRPRDALTFASSLRSLKRALAPSRGADSTSNLRTSPAVLDSSPGAAPLVSLARPAPYGPYVVSPAPSAPASAGPAADPLATVPGMSPPTGTFPLLAARDLQATEPTPSGVDRGAPTQTFAAEPAVRRGASDTAAVTLPSGAPPRPADGVAPLRRPSERPDAATDEPHVRPTVAQATTASTSATAIAMAVSTFVGLGLLAAALLLFRLRAPAPARSSTEAPPAAAAIVTPPPSAVPVVILPAPTIAPPALEEPPARKASPAPSALSAPAPRPRASVSPSVAAASSTPPRAPAPSPAPPTRPGPGF